MSAKKNEKSLRFAELIRVSTEKQEKQGESLRTQQKQVEAAVKTLGGKIVTRYAGQEHATSGWERKQLDKLLADAAKKPKPFDAVMVVDPSRWSRDNIRNEQGLEILKENGIRFFTLTAEHDLHDENARLFLAMSAVINSYNARTTAKKSILNRIERAKRGIPTSGDLPYGRRYDRKTGKWSIDPEEQKQLEDIARRYLDGEPMMKLAEEYGTSVEVTYLRFDKAGDVFLQRFKGHDPIEIKVPPLLPAKTLEAVRKKRQAQKTYQHGNGKHRYLLSGMICCGYCGGVLTGTHNNQFGQRYYRHRARSRSPECTLWNGHVPADKIEDAVIERLFLELGNPAGVQRAMEKAIPNREQVEKARERLQEIATELLKIKPQRDKIISRMLNETLTEEQADEHLLKLKRREALLSDEQERLKEQVASIPDRDILDAVAGRVAEHFQKRQSAKLWAARQAEHDFDEMTWEDKRSLLETVFSESLPDGGRMGVYVTRDANAGRGEGWRFHIRGRFEGWAVGKLETNIDPKDSRSHFDPVSTALMPP